MTPFDLEKALAGAPFSTKDGRVPKQYFFFDKSTTDYPFVCMFDNDGLYSYTVNGRECTCCESENDLVMLPMKKTWYFASWDWDDDCNMRTTSLMHKSIEQLHAWLNAVYQESSLLDYREHTIEIEE